MSWLRKSGGTWSKMQEQAQAQVDRAAIELERMKRNYEEQVYQESMKRQADAYQELKEPGYKPLEPLKETIEMQAKELAKARASAREAQLKLQDLQRAVASIVLRLKVLDVEALEKDLGEDGTVPLRLALSELKQLMAAYDGMLKTNMPDYGGLSYATTSKPIDWYQQQANHAYYYPSGSGSTGSISGIGTP